MGSGIYPNYSYLANKLGKKIKQNLNRKIDEKYKKFILIIYQIYFNLTENLR